MYLRDCVAMPDVCTTTPLLQRGPRAKVNLSALTQLFVGRHLRAGRVVIILLAVIGILPLLADPVALDATTISGTLIMGLGPPVWFLAFVKGYRPLTFHLPFWW